LLVSLINNALAGPPGRRDRASCRFSGCHLRRDNRAPRRYDIPRSRRDIHPERLHARLPLSRPRGAQRPGPDRALLADRPNSRASRPSPCLRGGRRAELRTSDGRARLADSVRLAVEEGGATVRQARSGARHPPRPAARRVRHLLYCWCLWQRHRRSEAAGGHRPAPSGRPAPSSASRCPPPEPVGGLGGAEDPGRDGRAAAGQRSRVHAAFRACAYVSRAGGRSCWLRADLSVRGCRRGEVSGSRYRPAMRRTRSAASAAGIPEEVTNSGRPEDPRTTGTAWVAVRNRDLATPGRRRCSGSARPRRRTRCSPGGRRFPCLDDARTCAGHQAVFWQPPVPVRSKRSSRSRSVIGLRRAPAAREQLLRGSGLGHDQRGDSRVTAQLVQAASAVRPNAADRDS
jgi:hypothetical protein